MKNFLDLHLHSRYSDGTHSPAELVRMAADRGLKAIALADHDSVDGIDEALAAGARYGVEVIPAVELSVAFRGHRDVHLLGYLIEHRDPAFAAMLEQFRKRREERGRAITERVNARLSHEHKGSIDHEEVLAMAGGAVGRPHIARVLISKGFARDMQDAFTRYLGPCNVPKLYMPITDALAEVKRIKGVAVLAHPSSISPDRPTLRGVIEELASLGLDGIEVYNNMCYDDDMIFFEKMATRLGLAMTGGSDFHGFEDDVEMGLGRGGLAVAYRCVEALKDLRSGRSDK
jgi:predicted metal-dependent phosphoesterase TrpH